MPAEAGPTTIRELPGGGRAFQADVPAREIPRSFATYEKQVDAYGQTLGFTKATYAPDGSIPGSRLHPGSHRWSLRLTKRHVD
jgi:hypothetical protein